MNFFYESTMNHKIGQITNKFLTYSSFSIILLILINIIIVTSDTNILHISDIHYDTHYYPGSPNKCVIGTKIGSGCCRKSSIGIKGYNKSSQWGDFNCDLPLLTVNSTFDWINRNIKNLNHIIYTGHAIRPAGAVRATSQDGL